MRIKIEFSKREEEVARELTEMIGGKYDETISGKWGYETTDEIYIEEECFIEVVNVMKEVYPKMQSLIDFAKMIFSFVSESVEDFKKKWM